MYFYRHLTDLSEWSFIQFIMYTYRHLTDLSERSFIHVVMYTYRHLTDLSEWSFIHFVMYTYRHLTDLSERSFIHFIIYTYVSTVTFLATVVAERTSVLFLVSLAHFTRLNLQRQCGFLRTLLFIYNN